MSWIRHCLAGLLILVVGTQAQWHQFPGQALGGARDMWRAYNDMLDANWKNSDKYFHSRGNYDAAQRGAGGKWIAEQISDAREKYGELMSDAREKYGELLSGISKHLSVPSGNGPSDSAADQEANRWGRNGGDPNRYRPKGLPEHY